MKETLTEAADWYARLRAESVSEIDAARFRTWLARDPVNRREFEALDALWGDLAAMEGAMEVERERAARMAENASKHRRSPVRWALAAGILVAVSIGAFLWMSMNRSGYYRTDVGEQRVIPLSDGSVITLNTATELRLRYTGERRVVELIAGQANFEVGKDPARPFVVLAGGGEVRALGTVFDVYKSASSVTVTLIEGEVAVAHGADTSGIVLAAGEQLSYAANTDAVRRGHADLPRISAWRERKLDFSDTPLDEAIAEANRYSRLQIELNAPELRKARISGVFEAGKNELFVEGLQSYFRLNVAREGGSRIVLTAARPDSAAD